ncbi:MULTISPECIES: DUF29 domain-containing protein [Testudinibacter]|uniref:DUF29 domain-containing protein n=1 Tax=Testudinibacter aquarius TaxID=1524974 RepID=A0A4R3Y1I6_9PAST|nr:MULTISPECIES: DUF29 domain-containing protein [Testudinibacter]TNG95639.1 DUF29 domain-containing protein [Pasteurellaceae bacterium UScroc12]TNH00141.1 DUF29 domain-containing protein [Pasteurellaceae bacterium UScroc31]TNH00602.1 DUF29 domain-containing protein [Pasteurellaceae bacterium USgator11]TNH04000.1 DUF29 domain-containing protein [Pasteurellaceae bacterium Phil31]KAE9525340.1 hypothetical protein A1D24_04670 [Testudinibacter aquarius]
MSKVYNEDFYGWVTEQTELLRAGALNQLDIENLIEEMESMGRSELSQLNNRFRILIAHLLKWGYQPSHRGKSWELTIKEQRKAIERLIKNSPSLKNPMNKEEFLEWAWESAIFDAARETSMSDSDFPSKPIWTLEEILSSDFFP